MHNGIALKAYICQTREFCPVKVVLYQAHFETDAFEDKVNRWCIVLFLECWNLQEVPALEWLLL